MKYRIDSIEPKQKYPRNRYYPAMLARECDVICLEVGEMGWLRVDMVYDPGNPHRIRTSLIQKVDTQDDGTIVFETENSVYTLVPNEKG